LETCCGYGYERARDSNRFARIFKDQRERSERRRSRDVLREQLPYLRMNRFHGGPSLKKKRKLSSELSSVSSSYFALPPFLDCVKNSQASPRPGSGILTGFPFDLIRVLSIRIYISRIYSIILDSIQKGIRLSLRAD
jgi:hypothetical protein